VLRPASRPDRAVRRLAAGVLTTGLLVGSVGGSALLWRSRHVTVPLLSDTVALTADGGRTLLATGDGRTVLPGTRVLRPASPSDLPAAQLLARQQRAWVDAGSVPGAGGPFEPMVRDALLDLRTMTLESGASLAGGPSKWRYVWPRDASFSAVALARSGHPDDAMRVLQFLAALPSWDGRFQARYLPDGSGPPDDRGVQEDGSGWVLWATAQVLASLPATERARPPLALLQMADRASARVLALTEDGTRLPPASADYWEVPETSLTLGTVAPLLAGLESAAAVYSDAGRPAYAGRLTVASIRLRARVEATFGARGYPRHVDGDAVDAAVTFVLPPFQLLPLAGAERAWARAAREMRRPGGGLAPGEGWKQDGISWTPETALFALSAASTGRPAQARDWLTWLSEHRTVSGSLPEKVLSNGEPAAVAPLTWTAALVVLAVQTLERPARP
jgi:GH15 family glucan-1,4-alpha-glucosidase